jgi:hypothetical protein
MPSENLHHRGREGTQRKTTEETVETQGKRGMPRENLHHRGHEGTQRKPPRETVEGKPQRKASKKIEEPKRSSGNPLSSQIELSERYGRECGVLLRRTFDVLFLTADG